MRKMFMMLFVVVIFIVGCSSPSYKLYKFNDNKDTVKNTEQCFKICKERESKELAYNCEYRPVICENGQCLCETY